MPPATDLSEIKDSLARIETRMDLLDEVRHDLYGNGKPGIKADVAELKADAKRRGRLVWVVIGAVIPLVASQAWDKFVAPAHPQQQQATPQK